MRAIITNEDVGTTIDFRTIGPYEAKHPWPEETVVSAGGGIVFVRNPKPGEPASYTTLFMEVYPPGAAFIRGEGETPEDCENAAWSKYQLAINCSDESGTHQWESRGYMNGAGFCAHCSTFGSQVFTGDQLGQHCKVCGVGTTHDWQTNAAGETEFLCKAHYVAPAHLFGTAQKPATLGELFGALLGIEDPAPTEPSTTPTPDEKSNTNE